MTKKELIKKVQDRIKDYPPYDISCAVEVIFKAMAGALMRGERVEIRGFGNFTVRNRRPTKGRNPKTSETVYIPARKALYFKVGRELNRMINGLV